MFKILALIALIYALTITNIYKYKSVYTEEEKEIIGILTNYQIKDNKISIEIKAKEKIVGIYYITNKKNLKNITNKYELGTKIKVKGKLYKPSKNTLPNTFNYQKHLYQNKIYNIIKIEKITKLSNNTSVLFYIKNKIIKRIERIDKKGYINAFIIGNKKELDEEISNKYQENGVSHLFAISGMHISLLAGIILYILSKLSYNNKINYSIISILLVFYLFLTNYALSILRATISYILIAANKCYNLKIEAIDIALIVLIIIIITNPLSIYNAGFQYSYSISLTLILKKNKIKVINNKLLKSLYISLICFIISIPITINIYYQINLISIIINIILVPYISIIIYPLSIITFIIPILYPIFNISVELLEKINYIVANIEIFKIIISKPNIIVTLIYYSIIILSLYKIKYIFFLVLIIIIHCNYNYLKQDFNITSIDVGQGDSILIKYPQNSLNILIDTGGNSSNQNYSIVKNKTIVYLKSLGIAQLNYLILTHGDYDHMGEAINLVNNFKVEKVIFNCGPYNDLEQELIKVLNKKKIPYYSCIKELNIDKNKLYFLQTKEHDNENDDSNVIYTELDGYKFMFMGDASITTEKEILNKYNLPDIDVLKVGHHGSKTSSGKEFINEINPKYSIISVGKNNRYGHPNKEVLDNLNNSKIYRTDEDGSIMFKINNNKLKIETCGP